MYFSRQMDKTQQSLTINSLEFLEALHRTVQLSQFQRESVLIKSDVTTVVQYKNKQGDTRLIDQCYNTCGLWQMVIKSKNL